jgi:hypothetical protein
LFDARGLSAGWLLVFGTRAEWVSCVRKRNRAKWCKSLVVMNAIAGGCLSSMVKECVPGEGFI